MYLLAIFSLFLSFSIDHSPSDLSAYSLALLGNIEPENAIAPPMTKEIPVSNIVIIEKYPENGRLAQLEPIITKMTKDSKLAIQIIKFPFRNQINMLRQYEFIIISR